MVFRRPSGSELSKIYLDKNERRFGAKVALFGSLQIAVRVTNDAGFKGQQVTSAAGIS